MCKTEFNGTEAQLVALLVALQRQAPQLSKTFKRSRNNALRVAQKVLRAPDTVTKQADGTWSCVIVFGKVCGWQVMPEGVTDWLTTKRGTWTLYASPHFVTSAVTNTHVN